MVTSPLMVSKFVWEPLVPRTNSVPRTPTTAVTVLILNRLRLFPFCLKGIRADFLGVTLNCPLPVNRETWVWSPVRLSNPKKDREPSLIVSSFPGNRICALEFAPVWISSLSKRGIFEPFSLKTRAFPARMILTKPNSSSSSAFSAATGWMNNTRKNKQVMKLKRMEIKKSGSF